MRSRMARICRFAAPGAMALALATAARPDGDEPLRVELAPGQVYDVCTTGTIICPAKGPVCDDVRVATPAVTPDGALAFRAVSAGSTLCSAASASGSGVRRVYRIVVRPER